ncbi:MAG: hypothetical protein BGN86_04115 [Caulobacterales bacterium 68-7]|nr:MAG: hypothetical protein BGN86_04115 [Caulobacterales bacterium 68-7]
MPGEESATNTENDSLVTEFLTMPGAIALMRAYIALPPAQRSPIVTLVEALKGVSQADAA